MIFNQSARFGTMFQNIFDRGPDAGKLATDAPFSELCDKLLASGSESQGQALARAILRKYNQSDDATRQTFFDHLLNDLDMDAERLEQAVMAYRKDPTPEAYVTVSQAGKPARIALFKKIAHVRNGAKCLVKIREHIRIAARDNPALKRLDHDLLDLLTAWFNRGFLALEPITWDTSAHILEKIIEYEAVHALQDWDDLRRRLQPADRRCYGFFHPRMPDDPIIFVEVALTPEIPNSVDDLLAEDRDQPDFDKLKTATFYSISNCHAGLAGISFGNALIKQVVRLLSAELPQLDTFVTLSPIPGLSKWADADADHTAKLGAQYITQAKRADGWPLDPVTRFHLGNGAMVHAVHENANSSAEGQKQSYGMMVNYLYDLDQVDKRAEAFSAAQTVAMSREVKALAKP